MAAGQQVKMPLRARLYCRTWRHCNNNNAIKSKKWSLWRWLRNETYKPQNSRDQALVRLRFPFAPPLCRFRPIWEPGDEANLTPEHKQLLFSLFGLLVWFCFLVVAKNLISMHDSNWATFKKIQQKLWHYRHIHYNISVIIKRVKIPFQYSSPVHSSPVFTDSHLLLLACSHASCDCGSQWRSSQIDDIWQCSVLLFASALVALDPVQAFVASSLHY